MILLEQVFLKPGKYHLGNGRYHTLTAEDLRQYMRNTLAVMRQGQEIPVLEHHGVPGSVAGGPRQADHDRARSEEYASKNLPSKKDSPVVGHLVDLRQESDGSLVHVISIPAEQDALSLQSNGTNFTSPELRKQFIDRSGNFYGPVIAHIALTQNPRNHDQNPLSSPAESFQLSLLEYEPGATAMTTETEKQDPSQSDRILAEDEQQESTPVLDSSPVTTKTEEPDHESEDRSSSNTDDSETIEQPETDDLNQDPHSPEQHDPQLLDEEASSSDFSETDKELSDTLPVSDHLVSPPDQENVEEIVTSDALSNDVGKNAIENTLLNEREEARVRLAKRIQRSKKIPRGLRNRLATIVEAIQLDESIQEEPSILVSDAVTMLEEALPEHVHLDPDELDPLDHPRGEAFFTGDIRDLSDEEAERIAREQLANTGFLSQASRNKPAANVG